MNSSRFVPCASENLIYTIPLAWESPKFDNSCYREERERPFCTSKPSSSSYEASGNEMCTTNGAADSHLEACSSDKSKKSQLF